MSVVILQIWNGVEASQRALRFPYGFLDLNEVFVYSGIQLKLSFSDTCPGSQARVGDKRGGGMKQLCGLIPRPQLHQRELEWSR